MSRIDVLNKLIFKKIPGANKSLDRHIKRMNKMGEAIEFHFNKINDPRNYKVKHLRWALERWLVSASNSTRYDYYLSVIKFSASRSKWPDWESQLHGNWETRAGSRKLKNKGGRPLKVNLNTKIKMNDRSSNK